MAAPRWSLPLAQVGLHCPWRPKARLSAVLNCPLPWSPRCAKKTGGADIPVVIGDMCEVRSEGTFTLVFLVFNTIDNLTTQEAQVACFQNAAAHLEPGGRFVIETQLPPLQRLPFGETRLPFAHDPDHWGVDEFDITTQAYSSHHLWIKDGKTQNLSVPFRYAWPSEMDLMARLAGMTLEHRWADWDRGLFSKDSTKHVSVWRKL